MAHCKDHQFSKGQNVLQKTQKDFWEKSVLRKLSPSKDRLKWAEELVHIRSYSTVFHLEPHGVTDQSNSVLLELFNLEIMIYEIQTADTEDINIQNYTYI